MTNPLGDKLVEPRAAPLGQGQGSDRPNPFGDLPVTPLGQGQGSERFYKPNPFGDLPVDPVADTQMMKMGFPQQNPETVTEARPVRRARAIGETGIPVDPTTRFPVLERADYESSRHNPVEVEAKFLNNYPTGEIKTVNVEGVGPQYFVKTDATLDNYSLINPVGLDSSDFGAVLAQAPEIAGGVVAALATKGASVGKQVFYDFMLPSFGYLAKELGESARGVQRDSGEDIARRAAAEGALNAAIGLGARSITGVRNLARSGSLVDDQGRAIVQAADELGLSRVPPNYLTENRAVHRFSSQSRAASSVMNTRDTQIKAELVERAQGLVGDGGVSAGQQLRDTVIPGQLDQQAGSILGQTDFPASDDFWFAGRRITQGTEKYIQNTRELKNALYTDALNEAPDGIMLDITTPQNVAKQINAGVKGLVRDESGNVTEKTVLEVNGELARISKAVSMLDGTQPFETVKQLRSELYQLKEASRVSGMTSHEKAANDLYHALRESMENPVGDYSAKFVAKYKRANRYNAGREKRINETVLRSIAKTENPADLARMYAEPGSFENLRILKKSLDEESWETLRRSFKRDLLYDAQSNGWHNSNSLTEVIDNWKKTDPRGFRMLVSEPEEALFRRIGSDLNELASSDVAKVWAKQYEAGKIAHDLIYKKGPDELRMIIDDLGGPGSEGHKLLKESFADWLFTSSLARDTKKGGGVFLNPSALESKLNPLLNDMRYREAMDVLFTPEELRRISNIDRVSSIFKVGTSDPGASLEVAADFASLKNITRGDVLGTMRGAHGIWMNRAIGKFMLSPMMDRFVSGSSKPRVSGQGLRIFASATGMARESISTMSDDAKDSLDKFIDEHRDYEVRSPQPQ